MIRLGLVDFDTSHVVAFTQRFNHTADTKEDQWVSGATVVAGCPGESKLAPDKIAGYAEQVKKYGVTLVDKPSDLLGKIDAVLIESVDGSVHWDRAKPFLEAGLPCFVDKPFACSAADARKMADLAAAKKVPLFSSSSLRFAPEVVGFLAGLTARKESLQGADVFGPAPLDATGRNPGLFHYGIHPVEVLFTLMGPGCESVTCTFQPGAEVAVGTWKGGRVGSVRGIRAGKAGYGFTAFTDGGPKPVAVGTAYIYRELCKQIVETFRTGKPPVDLAVTLEIVAFIAAALKSGANHGAVEPVRG